MGYCEWASGSELLRRYHDLEWGVPAHDDRKQFEHLMMEAMQCGLSWELMLKKREIFRTCFADFDFDRVAAFNETDVERILRTDGMIRARGKVNAVIQNARCFQKMREEFGSFSSYIWSYSDGKTILYQGHGDGQVPVSNGISEKIAKDLKKHGFKYIGAITVYSHLQACGIINDHDISCPCYHRLVSLYPTVGKKRYREVC